MCPSHVVFPDRGPFTPSNSAFAIFCMKSAFVFEDALGVLEVVGVSVLVATLVFFVLPAAFLLQELQFLHGPSD